MEVDGALIIVADDAGRAGQLDRTGQMQRLAVAIARLDWHFDHVAELRRLKTADCAEDHAVRDIVLSARLLKAEEHIRARAQTHNDDASELSLGHFDIIAHFFTLLITINCSTGMMVSW